jgi:hypothetical protein
VIDFRLEHGMKVDAKLKGGEARLYWAAYERYPGTVRLLALRGENL